MKPALYLIPFLTATVFYLIRSELCENRGLIYFFKPVSTILVICAALLSLYTPFQNMSYTMGVTLGLIFSLGGDIALMLPDNKKAFRIGLILFLLAHVVYAVIFTVIGQFSTLSVAAALAMLLIGLGIFRLLRDGLGPMKMPVIAYILIISVMMVQAFSVFAADGITTFHASMIVSGAVLFYISDVILALNRFWKPWKLNRISLAFYYSGQMLIALSASFFISGS